MIMTINIIIKQLTTFKKYDISKGTKDVVLKPDPKKVVENEIQTWLQEYKSAWEKGDIETLKELGHISSEKRRKQASPALYVCSRHEGLYSK